MATRMTRKITPQLSSLLDMLPSTRTVDADTVVDKQGSIRFEGLNAPEIQHLTPDGLKKADWGGQFHKNLYEELWTDSEYDNTYRSGEKGYYGRDLGGMENEDGRSFANKAVFEGVATPTNAIQNELADMGAFQRAFVDEVSGDQPDDVWAQAREKINQYKKDTYVGFKTKALDERQLSNYADAYGQSFSPFFGHDVEFRRGDRGLDNKANEAFTGGGWTYGMQSIRESANNALAAMGDIAGSEDWYDAGKQRARESRAILEDLPEINNDFTHVKTIGELGEWGKTAVGVALPYILGIVSSAVAGAVVTASAPLTGTLGLAFGAALRWQAPVAWVYMGEIYGNMEGGMDQTNAGIALAGGVGMALLDKVGLKGIFKASQMVKADALEQVALAYSKKNAIPIGEARVFVNSKAGIITAQVVKDLEMIAALQMSKALLAKSTTKGVLTGATLEGVTEMGQETISYQGGRYGTDEDIRKPFNMDEYKRIMANAAAGGIFLGGAIRGTSTAVSEIGGFKSIQRTFATNQKTDPNWMSGTLEDNMDEALDYTPDTKPVKNEPPPESPEYGSPEYYNSGAGAPNAESTTVIEEMKEEVALGSKMEKSKWRGGLKSFYTAVKEFPKKFTQRNPAYWNDKVLNNPNISKEAKEAFMILQTMTGGGKLASQQGIDIGEKKRILTAGLMAETRMIQSRLYKFLGVGLQVNQNLYSGITKEEANNFFVDYLEQRRQGKAPKQTDSRFQPYINELEKLSADIGGQEINSNGITDRLYLSVNGLLRGAGPGKKPFWFQDSRRLKKDVVVANKEEFVSTLESNGWTSEQANDFYDMLENGPAGYDISQVAELGFMNFPAKSLKSAKGVLEDVFGKGSKFLENDPFQRIMENTQEQINYAVDRRYLGKDGENVAKLFKIMKEGMGESWDPRIASTITDVIAASRGDYRRLKSKRAERMIGHITFFNTFGHLDLSALASAPEAAIVLLGATKDKKIMPLIEQGVREMSYKMRMDVERNWSYINPKSGVTQEEYTRNLIDFYRYGYDTGAHGAIGQVGIDEAVYKSSKIKEAIMKAFFTVNLLKVYTDATRVARLSLANDAIFGDLEIISMFPEGSKGRNSGLYVDAFERMRELNIDPDRAAADYRKLVGWSKDRLGAGASSTALYEEMIARDPDFMETMDIARMSWVDNAIAHPTAMNRPVWYSNPAYRIFTQYNGFMSVFTASILPKIWRRIRRADPSARYNAVAVATSMIALGFLNQMLKDEWRYDGAPSWITPKGYIQRGITSSGLVGTPERILSLFSPLYDMDKKWNESRMDNILRRATQGGTDLLGPSWAHGEQLTKIILNGLKGDTSRRNFYLTKEIPFLGKLSSFKEYNLGVNDSGITLSDALNNSTPRFGYPL